MSNEIIAELTYKDFKIGITIESKFIVNLGYGFKQVETYKEAIKEIDTFISSKLESEPLLVFMDIGNFHYEKGVVITLNKDENEILVKREDGNLVWENIDNLFLINLETEIMVKELMRRGENIKLEYDAIGKLRKKLDDYYSFEQTLEEL